MADNIELDWIDEQVKEQLENIVGKGCVSPRLIDLYRRFKYALDKLNDGRVSAQSLALLCVISGDVKLPHERAAVVRDEVRENIAESHAHPGDNMRIAVPSPKPDDGEDRDEQVPDLTDEQLAAVEAQFAAEEEAAMELATRPEAVAA